MSGLTKLAFPQVKEFRVHLCPHSQGSQGAREFILQNYSKIKAANQTTPFLVREAVDIKARLFARLPMGVERKLMLEGLSAKEIEQQLAILNQQS